MELPFSRLLKTCAADLVDESLWSAIGDFQHDGDEVRVSFKQVMDFHMLRFKSQSHSSTILEEGCKVTSVPRPEVIYNEKILRKHGLRDPACSYHLEQLLAPGDVIISRTYRQAVRERWRNTLSQTALLTGSTHPLEANRKEVTSKTRLVTWRNYPTAGMSTMAGVPFDPSTESFLTQVGSEMAWLVVVSPDAQNPGLITVIVGLFVSASSFPSWATSILTKMVHAMHELFQARMKEMKSISSSEALLKEDQSLYVTLSLRTCPQGRPLLPRRAPALPGEDVVITVTGVGSAHRLTTWFRPTGTFSLPTYLSDLLNVIGCDYVQVFDGLEGRQLVPYQAVLLRDQWEQIGTLFNDVWLTHRSAYKKLNCCKHAPTISDGRQAREADKPLMPAGYAENEPTSPYSIAVRNTFIEVGEEVSQSGTSQLSRGLSC